ncbi:transcriptional regulator [Sphaerisporangium siamense]|uniref:Transcriptional regulator with XRE-family HTH domain n=1 Tax=Sphaerisporangium siamense TaxID=795645 RepID=A0A7W7G838_9ACTN|nr:helix-turn-helix transcriptional regulator [Sphaerisporangium siamense]MBB4699847.1 transcriptional regulator with XRE-family HTH domain [Sphaerisporangium siamense]GII84833.1 transcriptional regulator [Sphaerisporangium siamense]
MVSEHAVSGKQAGTAPTWPRGGPTVLRMALGHHLRRLREARGITRDEAGYAIRGSESKISRLELGRSPIKTRDLADLLTLYGITDEREREALTAMARQAGLPGWWHEFAGLLPGWFEPYVGLEEAASVIRAYEVQFIPGLLQTPDYARAVIRLVHGAEPPDDIDRRVGLRMRRQHRLLRADGLRLWAIVDEAALRRPLGGPGVQRAQLEHLITAAAAPNISLQVLPFAAGGHAAAGGPITILRFAEAAISDVVYLEQLASALYLDKRADVDDYTAIMNELTVQAAPIGETPTLIKSIIDDL